GSLLKTKEPTDAQANSAEVKNRRQKMQWLPVQSTRTVSSTQPRSASSTSVVVAAGRSSDSGRPTPLPLPISIETVRWLTPRNFRSHYRCGTAPDSHQLPV